MKTNGGRTAVLVRVASFSSAHRYHSPKLSDAENRVAYGSLYRVEGFGHNFKVEAHIEGGVDPLTGMIVNLSDVDTWLKDVTNQLDHRFINDLPQFASGPVTTETMAMHLFSELEKRVSQHPAKPSLKKVRLYEGEQLWIDAFREADPSKETEIGL